MRPPPEALPVAGRLWHELGTFLVLALVVLPLYLMLNHYWQSFVLLVVCYAAFGLFCARLGGYTRRVMRRQPAEIPPWHMGFAGLPPQLPLEQRWNAAEALAHVRTDPYYVQEVLKPQLRQWLAARVTGVPDTPFTALEAAHLAGLEPRLLAFLAAQEPTGLWARYTRRQQRVDTVLAMCQYVEHV